MSKMIPRLRKKYQEEVITQIQKKFGIKNVMAVPRLDKIIINMGVGEAINDQKVLEKAMENMSIIAGQKPVLRRAKKAISNFKLRQGIPVGCKVTLRRDQMYEFLERLLNVTLPRIRDFNGVSQKSFDRQGNYALGLSDQTIFPEIEIDREHRTQGMDIVFVFNNGSKEQTFEVLRLLGMPFSR